MGLEERKDEDIEARDILQDLSELDEHDLARKYGLDHERVKILKAISGGMPLRHVSQVVTEELWLSEVLKLLANTSVLARTRALEMLAKYLGIGENKGSRKVVVDFRESKPIRRELDGSPAGSSNARPHA